MLRRALDRNPFLGNVYYFNSRLLEFRDKYKEAKSLCTRVLSNLKKKGPAPSAHHAVHYGCNARGSAQVRVAVARTCRGSCTATHTRNRSWSRASRCRCRVWARSSIEKLERQLLKKEAAIRDKGKQLNASLDEIRLLRSRLGQGNGQEQDSCAKLASQHIVDADDEKDEMQQQQSVCQKAQHAVAK